MARHGKVEYWLTGDGLLLLEGWTRDGLTDEQIAHNMGIAYSTFRAWRDKHEAISAVIKKNKDIVDYEVENALHEKALAGDVTAQIFWLKNRRPDKWRDRPVPEQNNNGALTDLIRGLQDGGKRNGMD